MKRAKRAKRTHRDEFKVEENECVSVFVWEYATEMDVAATLKFRTMAKINKQL